MPNDKPEFVCSLHSGFYSDINYMKDQIAELKDKNIEYDNKINQLLSFKSFVEGQSQQSRWDWKTVILIIMMLISLLATITTILKG